MILYNRVVILYDLRDWDGAIADFDKDSIEAASDQRQDKGGQTPL